MAIRGTTFANTGADTPHINLSAGAAGNVVTAGYCVGWLVKPYVNGAGFFVALNGASGVWDPSIQPGPKMYGWGDFSSGWAIQADVWQWVVHTKASGSAPYRWHVATYDPSNPAANSYGLVWSHGSSVGAANFADRGSAAAATSFRLGASTTGSIQIFTDLSTTAMFAGDRTDAQVEALFTTHAYTLTGAQAGWLLSEATAGSPIVDFTGGGANELDRASITAVADPTWFDVSLTAPPSNRLYARVGGVLVPSGLSGVARVAGVSVPFGG